ISKKSGDGAELTAVRTTASRLNRNQVQGLPTTAIATKQRTHGFRHHVELLEFHFFPRNSWIRLQRRLSFLSGIIDWLIDFFKLTTHRVFDNLRPGLIRFAQSHRITVSRSPIAA